MKFWIKERSNPQLGTYFVAEGRMSKAEARRMENTRYGENVMHGFDTEGAYKSRLSELRSSGEKVQ